MRRIQDLYQQEVTIHVARLLLKSFFGATSMIPHPLLLQNHFGVQNPQLPSPTFFSVALPVSHTFYGISSQGQPFSLQLVFPPSFVGLGVHFSGQFPCYCLSVFLFPVHRICGIMRLSQTVLLYQELLRKYEIFKKLMTSIFHQFASYAFD